MDKSAGYIVSAGEMDCAPGHKFRREPGFSYYTMGMVLSGNTTTRYKTGVVENGAGTIGLVPPGTVYELDAPDAHSEIWVVFLPRPEWHPWLRWPQAAGAPPGCCSVTVRDRGQLNRLLQCLRDILEYKSALYPASERLAELALETVLVLVAGLYGANQLDDRLERVMQEVRADIARPWTEAALADIAGLSPSRFAHIFREKLHVTPLKFVEQQRMDRAMALLMTTSLPVMAVGDMVGYADPLHFSKRFRTVAGVCPRRFRQSLHGR